MRLKSVDLSGFRGFSKSNKIDLDADAIILLGANGRGKTSLLDSIFWALSGSIPRLLDDSHIVSMFSESGQARVELELINSDSQPIKIIRTTDGTTQHLGVEIDGEKHEGDSASSLLLQLLWPASLSSPDRQSAFTTVLTRSVYLQQDLVKEFIDADSEQDRFRTVSELLGAGRVTELQAELERQRNAWTRATNVSVKELADLQARLSRLNEQLARLSTPVNQTEFEFAELWNSWWQRVRQSEIDVEVVPTTESPEAPVVLDNMVKQLEVVRRTIERRKINIEDLVHEIETHSLEEKTENLESVSERLEAARIEVATAFEMLTEAEQQSARERETLVQAREAREELRALAEIAMRHLRGDCPVCGQSHDESNTLGRLQAFLGASSDSDSHPTALSELVLQLAEVVREKQQDVLNVEAELRQTQEIDRLQRLWIVDRNSRLNDLGIDLSAQPDLSGRLKSLVDEITRSTEMMAGLQNEGEALALQLARMGEVNRRIEVERAVSNIRVDVEKLERSIHSREETGIIVTRMIEALREAVHDVVDSQLKEVESVLQRVYATIDPHPAFSAVRFLSRISRGRGHLATTINDPDLDLSSDSPETILSSSQINALAVSVFLSFNLGVSSIPIEATILDDPFQSLDDVNLLGMIDLLRRIKENRQLVISTHDSRFGQLLQRKLRPIRGNQRTLVIEFTDWIRDGPVIETWEIEAEIDRVLIAA